VIIEQRLRQGGFRRREKSPEGDHTQMSYPFAEAKAILDGASTA
jgi:hypothetical protein